MMRRSQTPADETCRTDLVSNHVTGEDPPRTCDQLALLTPQLRDCRPVRRMPGRTNGRGAALTDEELPMTFGKRMIRLRRSLGHVFALAAVALLLTGPAIAQVMPGEDHVATTPELHADGALTDDELIVLRVSEGILTLFEDGGADVWPGYSLARQPFLIYMPEKWALVFNVGGAADGFGPPPEAWRWVGHGALYHEGSFDGLVGQLAFGVPVGDVESVALGFPEGMSESIEHPEREAFAYIVHEAFHQYQASAFGETPWEREERYPIADRDNAARAWLEMRVLEDAVAALSAGDDEACATRTAEFVAVRTRRWAAASPFVESYERGKELLEGTAKYVELKCIELIGDLRYTSALDGRAAPLADALPRTSMAALLLDELRERRGEAALEPQDIPRNRIYAVASAEGVLLDHFGVDWKGVAEESSADFTYVSLLQERLGLDDARLASLADEAESRYGYGEILAAANEAARAYEESYSTQLAEFESQEGVRIDLAAPSSGVSRSRSSRRTKWLMEEGRITLCPLFGVYTLKADDWSLELHDAGLMEINDWDARNKEVVFYGEKVESVSIDGRTESELEHGSRDFESIEISGKGFTIASGRQGRLDVTDDAVKIALGRK